MKGRRNTGVPQGYVLEPLLWNSVCEGVLQLLLSNGTTIVCFADDIAIVSVSKMVREMDTAIRNVGVWLDEADLTLSAHKTGTVLISGRKIVEKMEVTVGHKDRIEEGDKIPGSDY